MTLDQYLKETRTTQVALGSRLGVSQGAVSQWLREGVPAERVKAICAESGGRVTPHELRPDLYPEGFEFPIEAEA